MHGGAYGKRVERAMVRELRLRELGYTSYSSYLGSAAWRDVKRRYAEACPTKPRLMTPSDTKRI